MRAYRIAYDGTGYRGFQRQPDVSTVEDALLDALEALDVVDPEAEADGIRPMPEGYAGAGRTDAGVSALAQTVAFAAPEWLRPRAINAELPDDVRAWAHADVPADFHATHDARERTYVYHLHAPGADRDLARSVLERLAGEHDVAALTPDDGETVRTLSTDLEVEDGTFALRFTASGFPRQFVRRAAELVRAVATGERPPEVVDRALAGESLDGPEGIPSAPPEPLVLERVAYDVSFEVDPEAATDAREVFAHRRATAEARARAAGRIERGIGPDRSGQP